MLPGPGRGRSGRTANTPATVEAYDYGFRASGLNIGNNTIEFSNTGTEPHHLIAAPYKPGATLAAVRKAFSEAREARKRRSISRTSRIQPGSRAEQSRSPSSNLDKPGKYALLCFVSDRKGGPPHVAQRHDHRSDGPLTGTFTCTGLRQWLRRNAITPPLRWR